MCCRARTVSESSGLDAHSNIEKHCEVIFEIFKLNLSLQENSVKSILPEDKVARLFSNIQLYSCGVAADGVWM
jgi:hypothetical protein